MNYTRAEKPTGENGSTSSLPMVEENHRGLCYASDWVRIEPNCGQDGHFLCFFMVMSSCYVMLLIWVAMPFMELRLADAVSGVLMELAVYDDDNFKRIVIITFCCVFVVLRAEVHY